MPRGDINRRRERFIDEYIICLNGSEACRRAGYTGTAIDRQASFLLRNVVIKTEIDKRLQAIREKNEITKENALKILWDIANSPEPKDKSVKVNAVKVLGQISGWIKDNESIINVTSLYNQALKSRKDGRQLVDDKAKMAENKSEVLV